VQSARSAWRLSGVAEDYDPLLERTRHARFVLLGEATHGTHEFYRERAHITKRLIAEQGCTAIVAEADWPDAYRVNGFVRGLSDDVDPTEALADFRRFPSWMWRNADVRDFVGWLRDWNDGLPDGAPKVGFYGLDLYSLHASMEAVIDYLDEVDAEAAERARQRYACFDHVGRDPGLYAYSAGSGKADSREAEVVARLLELRRLADEGASSGHETDDARFVAEQNARLAVDAERYCRAAFRGGPEARNLRERHMADTLDALTVHLARSRGEAQLAVWAHNSHVGDARATQMGERGELNLGQLVRERHGALAVSVGFTTYTGTVTAASDWGRPAERKHVRPALPGSWERLFHQQEAENFLAEPGGLSGRRLERAIGVVYRPETERFSHYFDATLAEQFDSVIHIDETHAVEPLERTSTWEEGELPATYPWALIRRSFPTPGA
jgi:erythromycin esterase-like protein